MIRLWRRIWLLPRARRIAEHRDRYETDHWLDAIRRAR